MKVHHADTFKKAWSQISTREVAGDTVGKLGEGVLGEKRVGKLAKRELGEKRVGKQTELGEKTMEGELGEKTMEVGLQVLGETTVAAEPKRKATKRNEKTVEDIMLQKAFRLKSKYLSTSGQAVQFIGAIREDSQFSWISEEIMHDLVAAEAALQKAVRQKKTCITYIGSVAP